jgi:hypothetical protein
MSWLIRCFGVCCAVLVGTVQGAIAESQLVSDIVSNCIGKFYDSAQSQPFTDFSNSVWRPVHDELPTGVVTAFTVTNEPSFFSLALAGLANPPTEDTLKALNQRTTLSLEGGIERGTLYQNGNSHFVRVRISDHETALLVECWAVIPAFDTNNLKFEIQKLDNLKVFTRSPDWVDAHYIGEQDILTQLGIIGSIKPVANLSVVKLSQLSDAFPEIMLDQNDLIGFKSTVLRPH